MREPGKEGELDGQSLRLQRSSKEVLDQPTGSPGPKVVPEETCTSQEQDPLSNLAVLSAQWGTAHGQCGLGGNAQELGACSITLLR